MENIERLIKIENDITEIDLSLKSLKLSIEDINKKIDKLCKIVDNHIVPDCDKMSNHINFIESVYNTVKNPLGFLCNRINRIINGKHYSLTDKGQTSFNHVCREISIQ